MKIFGVPMPFSREKPSVEKKYDLNGNRFYNEYIVERVGSSYAKPLKVAAALRAGLIIAEHIGRLPIQIKRVTGDAKELDTGKIAELLARRPNGWQTPMEFVESITLKAVFEGVGRAYIARDGFGAVKEFVPLLSTAMTVRDDPVYGHLYSGSVPGYGYIHEATRSDFIEIGNPHWTEISRLNVAEELKEIFGLAYALQKRQVSDSDLAALRGILTFGEALDPDAAQATREALKAHLPGVPILDSGAEFKELQASAADMQLLQTRQFAIEEVARAFGIHPLMLGHDAAGQSLTRVADVADYHINFTLGGWVERWEQAVMFSLLRPDQVAEFNTEKLFRMSLNSRAEWVAKALGAGGAKPWITEDEARDYFGLNPRGDDFWKDRTAPPPVKEPEDDA